MKKTKALSSDEFLRKFHNLLSNLNVRDDWYEATDGLLDMLMEFGLEPQCLVMAASKHLFENSEKRTQITAEVSKKACDDIQLLCLKAIE